jgi:hypothetical protein
MPGMSGLSAVPGMPDTFGTSFGVVEHTWVVAKVIDPALFLKYSGPSLAADRGDC